MHFQLNKCTKPTAPPEEAQIEQTPAKNIGQTQNVLTNTILKAKLLHNRHLKVFGKKNVKN